MALDQCGTESWKCLGSLSSPTSQWTSVGPCPGSIKADTDGQRPSMPLRCGGLPARGLTYSLPDSCSGGASPKTETVSCFLKVLIDSQLHLEVSEPTLRGFWASPSSWPSLRSILLPALLPPAQTSSLLGLGQPLHCLAEWPGLGHSTSVPQFPTPLESPRAWKGGRI